MSDCVTIIANGHTQQVDLPCTLAGFLSRCGWKPTQVVVEYNGNVLPRKEFTAVALKDGDRLEIILPVAGG